MNIVRGRLIGLNREDRSITIEGSDGDQQAVLHYDYLVLCTGLQYQLPQYLTEQMPLPRHVFTVNDKHQEIQMMQWIRERLANKELGVYICTYIHTCIYMYIVLKMDYY